MSTKKLADLNQLKLALLRSKADATDKVSELAATVSDTITELEDGITLNSTAEGSAKKFKVLVDDDGRLYTEQIS